MEAVYIVSVLGSLAWYYQGHNDPNLVPRLWVEPEKGVTLVP